MIRIMIGLLLAGSAFLGWQATQQRETIARYEAAVAEGGAAEKLAQRILRSAFSYTQYKERSAKDSAPLQHLFISSTNRVVLIIGTRAVASPPIILHIEPSAGRYQTAL